MIGTNIFIGEKDIKSYVQTEINGEWVTARPIGYISFFHRLKCAWLVFTNDADIVIWEQDGWGRGK